MFTISTKRESGVREVDSGYFGILVAAVCVSTYAIGKAILEAGYFKDRKDARKTLSGWVLTMLPLAIAFGFAKLYDYFG